MTEELILCSNRTTPMDLTAAHAPRSTEHCVTHAHVLAIDVAS